MTQQNLMIFSAMGSGLAPLGRAFQRLRENHPDLLNIHARSSENLFDKKREQEALDLAARADHVFVLLHGGKMTFPLFDALMETAGGQIFIMPSNEEDMELSREFSSDFGSDQFNQWVKYIKYGGEDNWHNLLKDLAGLPAQPPSPQPCQAMYHPKLGAVDTLEQYAEGLGLNLDDIQQSAQPVMGIWFGQNYWLEGNLEPIDCLIREVERQGAVPVCCLYRRHPDPQLDVRDTSWIINNYFRWQGRNLIQVLLSPMMFSITISRPGEEGCLSELDVPVLQTMLLLGTRQFWEETYQAVNPMDVCVSLAHPEFDGNLITVPLATRETGERDPFTGAVISRAAPINERIVKLVRLAKAWAGLSCKPNQDKKVAIVLHNYPPRNDRIGCAYGLDSFASVCRLMDRLRQEGYNLERAYDPQELADALVSGLTSDQRWLTPEAMAQKAADLAGPELHQKWRDELPAKIREHQAKDWGPSPGELFMHDNKLLVNGLLNGNVYVGIQPPRGFVEQPEKIHDPYLAPSHHYLFYYRWLRDVFQADAVLHIGKHGSLEWLPGKSAALSDECYPDLAIMDLPNIYPYIINDPSEGTQAKRRSYCCILDHLIPVMTNADTYEEMAQVDNLVLDYLQTKSMNPTRLPVMQKEIWQAVEQASLHRDLETTEEEAFADFDAFLEKLHAYLNEVGDTAISDGLHTFGQPPQGEGLVELATQLVRLTNGDIPSLREAVARHWGYDYDRLLKERGKPDPTGRHATNAQALNAIHDACRDIVQTVSSGEPSMVARENAEIDRVKAYLENTLLPNLVATSQEMDHAITALSGRFVPPGPSGAPTRGQADILPTGRNFYSVDPQRLPSPAAWRVGVDLGRDLVRRHVEETGGPPDNIGMVLWGGPTMRTQGEDVAEALFLMGLRPEWHPKSGRVIGVEVVPLEELEFPRVDITYRTSGFFRDSFPNLMELLDGAAQIAASLNEPPESNMLRRNVMREVEMLAKQGLSREDAFREACFRVYSCAPGTYGAGLPETIDAKAWETSDDLGEVWINRGAHAYGQQVYGARREENFRRRLKDISLVVKNEDSREYDILSSDDFNAYFGGFVCAVKTVSGVQPRAYSGDASDPDRVHNRSIQEESKHIFRSRILNPKWIQGLMRHGFKGAGDLSRAVDISFHWDSTTGIMEDWMYNGLAEKYAFDEKMREWLKKVNPYALQNITERLLEAISRGMWQADQETKERLESLYLEAEGDIEDAQA